MSPSVTYGQSRQSFRIPDNTDAILTGLYDQVTLGSGDSLLVAQGALDNDIYGDSSSAIILDQAAYVAVQGGTVQVDPGVVDPSFAGSGTIDVLAPNLDLEFFIGSNYRLDSGGTVLADVAPGASALVSSPHLSLRTYNNAGALHPVAILPGTASAQIDVSTTPGAYNVIAHIQEFTGIDGTGAKLADIYDFPDGTSQVNTPGSGAFGIYMVSNYYNAPGGTGILTGTLYDIYNGSTEYSIEHTDLAGLPATSLFSDKTTTYQLPDGQGSIDEQMDNFKTGGSVGVFAGPAGQFPDFGGVTDTFYSGPGETGRVLLSSNFIFHLGVVNTFPANGAFGVYDAVLQTTGGDAMGYVLSTTFNYFGGAVKFSPVVSNPPSGPASSETEVRLDTQGNVLSSTTVPVGTAANLFQAFVGYHLAAYDSPSIDDPSTVPTTPAELMPPGASMSLADFAASPGSVMHAPPQTTGAGLGPTVSVPAAAGTVILPTPIVTVAARPTH